ncbi:MAG: hypothetical protein ACRCWQ_07515 [Bacilli bacterium]
MKELLVGSIVLVGVSVLAMVVKNLMGLDWFTSTYVAMAFLGIAFVIGIFITD